MTGVTITGILKLSKRFQDDCEKIINNAVNKAINEPVRICKNCMWWERGDSNQLSYCENQDVAILTEDGQGGFCPPETFGCNQWKENGSDKGAIIVGGHLLEEGETIAEILEKFDSEQIDDMPNAIVDNRIVVGVTKEEYRDIIKKE